MGGPAAASRPTRSPRLAAVSASTATGCRVAPAVPSSCTTVSPGAGWTCVSGNWLPPSTGGSTTGCTTPQPDPSWTCLNGNWLPPGSPQLPPQCPTIQPGPGWTCVGGNWLPPGFAGTSSGGSSGGCFGSDPFAGIANMVGTCVNGNWIPRIVGTEPSPDPDTAQAAGPAWLGAPELMAPDIQRPQRT